LSPSEKVCRLVQEKSALRIQQDGNTLARRCSLLAKAVVNYPSVFVDFDHGLNAAAAKLRQALGDSARLPRFVESVPRRGYRFIAPVEIVEPMESKGQPKPVASPTWTRGVPVLSQVSTRVHRSFWFRSDQGRCLWRSTLPDIIQDVKKQGAVILIADISGNQYVLDAATGEALFARSGGD